MKTRKKFVNLIPISNKAKYRFFSIMNSFHACEIKEENENMFLLQSINGEYITWVPKEGNEHWKIVK